MTSIFQVVSLVFSLEGAYLPDTAIGIPQESYYSNVSPFAVTTSTELDFPIFTWDKKDENGIYVGFSYQNIFVQGQPGTGFIPLEDIYRVNAGLKWNELTIGVEHTCVHSVESKLQYGIISQELFAAQDKIFARITGKL